MIYTVTIPMKLPSLNEYTKACRGNKYGGAKFKADIERDISIYLSKLPKIEKPVAIKFTWVENNKRRDLDNVCYAKKHILDALVKCGVLTDDNRKYVKGFVDCFEYDKEARVIVEIREVEE